MAVDHLGEYCHFETFNASCEHLPDHVVVMTSARYGRMKFGRCMREDHGSVGCSADVLPQLDRKCSGRPTCHVTIPDAALHNVHPCPRELMPYLEASYSCLPGNLHTWVFDSSLVWRSTLDVKRHCFQLCLYFWLCVTAVSNSASWHLPFYTYELFQNNWKYYKILTVLHVHALKIKVEPVQNSIWYKRSCLWWMMPAYCRPLY